VTDTATSQSLYSFEPLDVWLITILDVYKNEEDSSILCWKEETKGKIKENDVVVHYARSSVKQSVGKNNCEN